MKVKLLFCFIFFMVFQYHLFSQIKGKVTDKDGTPLPFVNIYFEGTINGTTTNDNGIYELELNDSLDVTIVYKYLGYTTKKITPSIAQLPFILDVVLQEETLQLNEVAVTAKENPAIRVIKNAIKQRAENRKKLEDFTADFYSKGLIRIKDAPKKILGQDLGDYGGGLDSTRSGIIYLSETISKIAKSKNEFKEKIVASKVSGDDNGFSFNNASDVNFSFYGNTVEFGNQLISPIADNAFNYYRYRLIGTFYDDHNNLINQIKVIPKRSKDRVFTGDIYIVENKWSIYAADFKVTGLQTQILPADTISLTQDFIYSKVDDTYLKVLQSIDFQYGIFGFKGNGRFTAGYKNYKLNPEFEKKDFTNEVLSFADNANKKDSLYWNKVRAVPLTLEEQNDYQIKDSLEVIRKSQKYLDSVDAVGNKLNLGSLLFGYTYSNTFKEKFFTLTTPFANTQFNTVQGWNGGFGFDYLKLNKEKGTRLNLATSFNYGLSEKRFRPKGSLSYRFNNFSRPFLSFSAGSEAKQFNNTNPITPFGNTFVSLLFEKNFAKFYERNFSEVFYSQEITNGIYAFLNLGFEDRQALFNTTDYVLFGSDNSEYTSNNPLNPDDFENSAVEAHNIFKFSFTTRIRFNQKYLNYPDGKFNYSEDRYPTLLLGYEKGFASNTSSNNFDQFKIRLYQNFDVANKGRFAYNFRAGTFLNGENISFIDYQHFNGNRTRITRGNYLNSFFLLPYYNFSTNKNYFEGHLEHNFKGFIMQKIPLLNKLNAHLILSGKILATTANQPYSEFGIALGNLGWNKFRFLRFGYVQRHFNGITENGINVGLQF
ncbi:DUF5686 and carboxypeptidase regulatory-like domain-containing protein [Croceitalea vernalis]|uniref:DUF5686 and carboxypeptidase regulatory-like domain-containing protein n=1 Tax=Croceitalea vernalis TaxID=3075599 RepID=A0ABU3BHY4_9FLAO|nr:DUF5686 and carboxypeptidase regulatory-like domain-containing protein [Croceitalea sp. P007]MDT0621780.1 DUF5686 and carboxypeptidase regulatory-like domain-containing protein [Croceitalea sp. P007]